MALRTFRSNPSLGGFGGESSNAAARILNNNNNNNNKKKKGSSSKKSGTAHQDGGDAFAQIVKELVDNAVDACSAAVDKKQIKKRVRVTIERFEEDRDEDSDDEEEEHDEILRVTVSDNGCGMESIQACVDPFHTSKAHQHQSSSEKNDDDDDDSSSLGSEEGRTAGRYGIGLTLCLLHAQRLVPDSCASIKSATADHHHWTLVTCVVDADGDSVRCVREERLPKAFEEESGTSVSVLVPGGATAAVVWPRLAEYFARFKLSLGLTCSLEVLAPTLSKVPLLIRPAKEKAASRNTNSDTEQSDDDDDDDDDSCDSRALYKGFDDDESEQQASRPSSAMNTKKKEDDHIKDRMGIWRAVQHYLERPVELKNIAHALVPIRFDNASVDRANRPKLEVDMIVRGSDDQTDDDDDDSSVESEMSSNEEDSSGKLVLIRMVNRIPLLDSAEAVACGLVQGLAAKKRVWHSFGLDVTLQHDIADIMKLPTFQVRDSEQVAPFFQKGSHELFREHDEADVSDVDSGVDSDSESMDDETQESGVKRKRKKKRSLLLPAKVRLANILMIVQIHASPTTLPLPTLSKGRLPIDNTAIDAALEVGLGECLRQLQKTSPSLLLSANELRKAERDARYVPAVASALASILCKSTSPNQDILDKIRHWSTSDATSSQETEESSSLQDDDTDDDSNGDKSSAEKDRAKEIGSKIESRLRLILSQKKRPNRKDTKGGGNESSEEESSRRENYDDDLLERSSKEGETEDESSRGSLSSSGGEDPKASQSTGHDDYDDWL